MSFKSLGLSKEVLRAVAESGYTTPTPIQEKAIPYILMGRDVLGVAQTGTGKTASFTLPMIDILGSERGRARMPRSLILEPTRELATQVAESFEKYGRYTKLSMALLIGGESLRDQQQILQRGVDVLIATPGRLLDLFDRGLILLADAKLLVIDEADRMLDMGFIPDIERIVSLLPPIRQTLFFSATIAPEIRKLAEKFLHNPKEIRVAPPASPAETVTQRIVRCGSEAKVKRAALRSLIQAEAEEMQSALVFCNRKRDVAIVQRSLQRHGFDAEALHGDMVQSSRTETLARFKAGEVRILVCSDVAARGLDIPAVSHVYNYDVPVHAEDYVHRIGRTGRAGRSGKAFTLYTPDDTKALAGVTDLIGSEIEELQLPDIPVPDPEEYTLDKRRRSKKSKTSESTSRPGAKQKKTAAQGSKARDEKKAQRGQKIAQEEEPEEDLLEEVKGPFGDHTPAFILRPVPLSANA